MASTLVGPIRIPQINRNYYVGEPMQRNIQQAVTFAIANSNSGTVIIPQDYAGSDTVAAVTNGSATVFIMDERNGQRQVSQWFGDAYKAADFIQFGPFSLGLSGGGYGYITSTPTELVLDAATNAGIHLNFASGSYVDFCDGNGNEVAHVDSAGNATFSGDLTIQGDIGAPTANFATCIVDDSPVRTFANTSDTGPGDGMLWPDIGIAVSLGDHWQSPSIDPAMLATYPAAGIAVSNGTTWSSPIDPATIPLLNAANTFTTGPQTINGGLQVEGNILADGNIIADGLTALLQAGGEGGEVTAGLPVARLVLVVNGQTGAAFPGQWIFETWSSTTTTSSSNDSVAMRHVSVGPDGASPELFIFNRAGNLWVSGTITAGVKSFRITHPLDDTKNLNHSCIEGPEIAVYYRGEDVTSSGSVEITLPEYFESLTRPEGRTVMLTQLFEEDNEDFSLLAASRVTDGKFSVQSSTPAQKFYWEVKAVRADVEPLEVTTIKEETTVARGGKPEAGKPKP